MSKIDLKNIDKKGWFIIIGGFLFIIVIGLEMTGALENKETVQDQNNSVPVVDINNLDKDKNSLYSDRNIKKDNRQLTNDAFFAVDTADDTLDFDTLSNNSFLNVPASTAPVSPPVQQKVIVQQKIIYKTAPSSPTPVVASPSPTPVAVTPPTPPRRKKGFVNNYNTGAQNNQVEKEFIAAEVMGSQEIGSGGRITIRILEESYIQNVFIPKNTILYGIASLGRDRVIVSITSIKTPTEIIQVKMNAYDNDGIQGIYSEALLNHTLKKEAAQEAINQGETSVNIPGLGNFSTEAFKKKLAEPKIPVQNGHKLTLKI